MPPTTTDISPDGPPLTRAGLQIHVREDAFSRNIGSLDFAVSNGLDRRVAHLDMAKGKGRITALLLVDRYPGLRPSRIAQVLLREGPAKGRITDDLVTSDDLRHERIAVICAPNRCVSPPRGRRLRSGCVVSSKSRRGRFSISSHRRIARGLCVCSNACI